MKRFILLILLFTLFFQDITSQNNALTHNSNTSLAYIENKGQVCDQHHKPNSDILYSATDGKLVCLLKKNSVSYQLDRVDSWKDLNNDSTLGKHIKKVPDQITIYRLDINWINANTNVTINKGLANENYDNYYLEQCPNGILNVKNYQDVTYKSIYNGIDLKWYYKEGHLKYDYLVSANGNYKQIQLTYKGAENMIVSKEGELIIKTPLGNMIEQAPVVIQNGKTLKAKWVLKNNIVSYDIENINPHQSFIIDPLVRTWGTYYGGNNNTQAFGCTTDSFGNVFMNGTTLSNTGTSIATVGSHQTILNTGFNNSQDAFLVKFNSLGVRQWGTYYGGDEIDYATSCCTDIFGNLFLLGVTQSNTGTGINTLGSHQPNYGGGLSDVFLVKFDNAGVRQWGTYYGGNDSESAYSCSVDALGNVYIAGYAWDYTGNEIATAGSHQPNNSGSTDAFLAKFNTAGVRQWGTYYGGLNFDGAFSCVTDLHNNVYLSGNTGSVAGTYIATPGSHQPTIWGLSGYYADAFLVKFNANGVRQWGTYYGGNGNELNTTCATDLHGNVYIAGVTNSTVAIATSGCHQPIFGGGTSVNGGDGFLAKFDSTGVRSWGTYYGGSLDDGATTCIVDSIGNVFISGSTTSTNVSSISTSGSYQSTFGGGLNDAFLAKFDSLGTRQWGTYYGGNLLDIGHCTIYKDKIYLAGYTESSGGTIIASASGHQPTFAGAAGTGEAFLVQFSDCNSAIPPINNTPVTNQIICSNNSTILSVSGIGTINWYTNPVGGVPLGTGSVFITPNLSVGTYTYYSEDNICTVIPSRTAITVTVNALPIISVNSGTVCSGNSFTIVPAGAYSYTYSSGNSVVTPMINTNYLVTGSDINGCVGASVISSVTVNAIPVITVNSGSICSGDSFIMTPTGAYSYTYSNGSNIITPTVSSTYTIIGESIEGCVDDHGAISTVSVVQIPVVSITGNTITCASQPLNLTATGIGNFLWNTGETTANIISYPTSNTTYSIKTNNACGSDSDFIFIIVHPLPTVTVSHDTSILVDNVVNLFADGGTGATYAWSPLIGCHTCSINTVSPTTTTVYIVTVTNSYGCSVVKNIIVNVENNFEVFIPDVFSPNGDGQNDILYVRGLGIKDLSFKLYDRLGEKIFETTDVTKGWDGSYKGAVLNNAVFVYELIATMINGNKISKHGDVTLIR